VAVGRGRVYYGWYVVAMAALAMVGTLPGRTQGLGLITEPLLGDLGLDRVLYATINFWATIVGAAGALGIGRLIDRFGTRIVLTAVAGALGLIVGFMSQVTSLAALAVAMTLTRAFGQSALSVVSIAMVGLWFVRRVNTAMAIYSVALSIGFMIAFPVVGSLVQTWGWRSTWLTIGAALTVILAPASWLVVRSRPETIGLHADGEADGDARRARVTVATEPPGHRWGEAMSTGAFWVFALGAALYGLVASGIGLFNESILAERGFGHAVY
jgi:sugar phosphate permease